MPHLDRPSLLRRVPTPRRCAGRGRAGRRRGLVRTVALTAAMATLACSRPPSLTREEPGSTTSALPAVPAVRSPDGPPTAPGPRRPLTRATEHEPAPPYNVLLILVDAMRADMPWAGYPRDIAPRLSTFERRAVSYHRAYALSSYTAKSVVPLLAGEYASAMQRDGYFFTRWSEENLFVTERIRDRGNGTLSGQAHGYFLPSLARGALQGFEVQRMVEGTELQKQVHGVTGDKLYALALEVLRNPAHVDQSGGRRFFAYFHFIDPHHTYEKHPGHPDFGDDARDRYDNEIHYTDALVGKLLDFVDSQPWGAQTVVIISADHGEGFGERNHYRHSFEVWEALVRVPLLIAVPGAPPRRMPVPRGHLDLAPTIAELMGLGNDPPFRGRSLVPELFGETPEPRPIVVDLPRCDLMDRRRALIDGRTKLIAFGDDQRFMLFDVVADPAEVHDLAASRPEELARMKALYQEISAQIPNVPVQGGAPLKGAPRGRRW